MQQSETAPQYVATMTAEELGELVEQRTARVLESQRPPPEYLTRQRLAEVLDVSLAIVDKDTRDGCPFVYVGDSKRYRLADVHAFLEARTKAALKTEAAE